VADGPDSSSLPERLSLPEDDVEFESFFLAGEEGTYGEGAPESLAPVYADVDFDEPDEDFYERHEAQVERRERFRRHVSRTVGSLGLGLLFALVARAPGTNGRDAAAPELAARAPAAVEVPVKMPGAAAEQAAFTDVPPENVQTFDEVIVAADPPQPAAVPPPAKVIARSAAKVVAPLAAKRSVTPARAVQLPSSGL
jgi:hypothetical protein